MKIAKPYPYLYKDEDRQGNVRWRLRAPGRKTVTIKGAFGSPEFAANYRAAMEGGTVPKGIPVKHGNVAALARSYLRSAAFAELSPTTQRARRHLVEQFVTDYGTLPVAGMGRRHVKMIMDANAARPGKARNVLSMIRILMALAIEEGIRSDDPTVGVKRPKLSKGGWHTWDEAEIEQYEAKHPVGSQARLALALALYTAQRRSDVIRMGKQHIRNGTLSVQQQKTGTKLAIPIHPTLQAILDATPSEHLTLLVAQHGKTFTADGFGHRFKLWCREAGLRHCSMHGLRKAACRRLAEAGCTTLEIMAISGHKTLSEVERYTKSAEQKHMAERAISRTKTYPRPDQSYPRSKKG